MKPDAAAFRLHLATMVLLAVSSSCLAAESAKAMPASDPSPSSSKTSVSGQGAVLDAAFDYRADERVLAVSFRLRNSGTAPLAVFDRGDRHAVASGRQTLGHLGAPKLQTIDGGIRISHIVWPLPRPTPVSPPTPLAQRLAPGESSEGHFKVLMPGTTAPARVRWCLGVAPFDPADFSEPGKVGGIEIWRASFALADRQQILCTPWYDVAAGRFAAD